VLLDNFTMEKIGAGKRPYAVAASWGGGDVRAGDSRDGDHAAAGSNAQRTCVMPSAKYCC